MELNATNVDPRDIHAEREMSFGSSYRMNIFPGAAPYGRNNMRYEVTIKIEVKTPRDKGRVAHQIESLFEFGAIDESIADGLTFKTCPRFQATVLSKHLPVALDEQELRTLCLPRRNEAGIYGTLSCC